jgi:UDP-glucose 4-epimerase
MTILVTGGAGYIGSHMVHTLADAGESVVVLDNLSTGFEWAVPKGVPLVLGETGDPLRVAALIAEHRVDSIIHFAASIVVPDSVRDPLGYYRNNTMNSRSLLEVAVNSGVRQFIFSSTAAVYGNPEQVPVSEDATLTPMSPYGSSKLMTEVMLKDVGAAYGLKYVILRYFNVAGADADARIGEATPDNSHLIKVACETAIGLRPSMRINGTDYPTPDGTCIRDYVHVDDLARAHLLALERLAAGERRIVANCGYGHGFSVREVLGTARRVSGIDFPIEEGPRRPGDPPVLVAETSRIRTELGWAPRHDDLEYIVATAWRWEQRLRTIRAGAPGH